jgi:hypothetical protein
MSIINITKDMSGNTLNPYAKIIVDEDVARKIIDDRIVLGLVKKSNSIIVLQRRGKTANKRNGGRSFAKLITGQSRVRRHEGADVTDYRRTAFKTPAPMKSSLPSIKVVAKTPVAAATIVRQPVVASRKTSVIDIFKKQLYTGTVAAPPPKPVKVAKPAKTKPVQVAGAKRKLGPNEVRIEFPDGAISVGSPETVLRLLNTHIYRKSWGR